MAKEQLPPDDGRLGEIREGAGLEDSRINQEFVDFIKKWSTPVLLVLAAVAVGYFLYNKRIEARELQRDAAFTQYNQTTATNSPSPDALQRIAEEFSDVEGVRVMATLDAADQYLFAVHRGVRPGTPLDAQTGEPENDEDYLTGEDRTTFLSEAEGLYQRVVDETQGRMGMAIHTLEALYGIAAVAESRGDDAGAKAALERVVALSEQAGFVEYVERAQERIALVGTASTPVLLSKADLPEPPAPPEPDLDLLGPLLPDGEGAEPTDDGGDASVEGADAPVDGASEGAGDGATDDDASSESGTGSGDPAGDPGDGTGGDGEDGR